ncbi:MAG: exodeoxyribonuclease VII small subunit [Nitrospinota bacterium]|nr:exodeoxyribonuclease VII small subunit [Nitrospinota bacterium]
MNAAKKSASSKKDPENFEEALERLEEIVEELEGGEAPLEGAVGLYEEGVTLFRYCREQLDSAQKRVEELAGEAEEVLSLRSFEDEDEEEEE